MNPLSISPVTPMQEVMYARALYGITPGVDIEHVDVDCASKLDVGRLQSALRHWVQEFEVLRTGFANLQVVQVVHDSAEVSVEMVDLSNFTGDCLEKQFARLRNDSATRRFELATPPLVRVMLCELSGGRSHLIITLHHLLYDGRCAAELIGKLFNLYDGIPRAVQETAPRPSMAEFAKSVRERDPEKARPFFENLLKGFSGPQDLRLATPQDQLPVDSDPVGYVVLPLSLDLLGQLDRFADRVDVTVNTLLQVAWAVLLARYSGTADVVWGTTRAARRGVMADAQRVVGMCINTLPCRLQVDSERTLADAAQELRRQHIDIRPHEHTSMADVRKWCASGESASLFTTLVLFERFNAEDEISRRISVVEPRKVRIRARPGFDLTVMLTGGEAPRIEVIYERATVRDSAAGRVTKHIHAVLNGIAHARPDAKLGSLAHIPDSHRSAILQNARGPQTPYPRDCTVTQLFERQVDARPDAVCLKDDTRTYTYRQVEQWANQFASMLRQRGVAAGAYVPILMERSAEYVITALAVLKSGATYVPLDASAPPARLEQMLEATHPRWVITTHSRGKLLATEAEVLLFDRVDLSAVSSIRVNSASSEIANVIFTSGSTGVPKGVMLTHRSVVHLTHNSFLPFLPDDVYLFLSSIAFDTSNLELWSALLTGASLAISPDGPFDFDEIRRRIRHHGITRLWLTSSLFNAVADADPELFQGIKTVIAGGEALSPAHLRRALQVSPATHFVNGYGPTECSTFTTTNPIPGVSPTQPTIPIGRPLDHAAAVALDIHGQPVDTGFAGELFIAGDGLSLGYLGDEALTASKFVTLNLFGTPQQFYRSGDLIRLLDRGELDFIARIDQQVKLRGYRIDLGEIEAATMKFSGVASCAVLARGKNADKHLLLCVAPAAGEVDASGLRQHLRNLLPEYMVPRDIYGVPRLPVTINGKLDKAALELQIGESQPASQTFQQPVDKIELAVLRVFSSVLGVHDLPVDVGLVGLGFNSLSIVDLSLRLKREFGGCCPNLTLTGNPSARDLARLIGGEPISTGDKPRLLISMNSSTSAPPVFIVPGIWGDPFEMRHLAIAIGQHRPVFTLRSPGLAPREHPRATIAELARDYASALEDAYPKGPIHVVGYSFGATVAYELVQQLTARQRLVRFLGLIDSPTLRYLLSRRRILLNRLSRLAEQPERILDIVSTKLLPLIGISDPNTIPNIAALSPFEAGRSNFNEKLEYEGDPAGIRVARRLAKMLCMPALKQIQPVIRSNLLAYARYSPAPYDGSFPVHLFACEGTTRHETLDMGWRRVIGEQLKIWTFPGEHNTAVGISQSAAIAGILRGILADGSGAPVGTRTLAL